MEAIEPVLPTIRDASRDFLARARNCFAQAGNAPEMLLYAALELRLGIEARLHEHLNGAEQYADLKKRGWKVQKLAKDLEKVFNSGTKIVSFTVLGNDASSKTVFLFTPVTSRARQIAQQLGEYLHYTERFTPAKEVWKNRLQSLVDEGIRELEISTKGTLLAPPMWKPKTRKGHLLFEGINGDSLESLTLKLGKIGDKIVCKVTYHDSLPL